MPAISNISSLTGLPSRMPLLHLGSTSYLTSRLKQFWWFCSMVEKPATPGAMLLRPPPKPAKTW